MTMKRNPFARHVDRHTLGSNCDVGVCAGHPFPTKCVSTIKACGETAILHMLAELFAPYARPPSEIMQ